jgi:threonine synthase
MDSMLIANRNGNIACTQGGESMAGLRRAIQAGFVDQGEVGILDSTAHMLKFVTFQEMYFQNGFAPEFNVKPKSELKNAPTLVKPKRVAKYPEPGKPLQEEEMRNFVHEMTKEIAKILDLKPIA